MAQGRLPNFLGIGAPRTGTTWLYYCLKAHPEAFVPAVKEVCFFIRDQIRTTWHKGLDWYQSLFVCADRPVRVWGELSPRYYFLERTPGLIREHIPDVKIIYQIRHPVELLHSAFGLHLSMRRGAINPYLYGFHETIEQQVAEVLGFFARYLQRYAACFAREQILVLFYEDLRDSPAKTFARVCHFLGIDATVSPAPVNQRVNRATIPRRFLVSGIVNSLASRLGPAGRVLQRWDERHNQVLYNDSRAVTMSLVSRDLFERLMLVYQDDVHELEELTGRDLRHWFDFTSLDPSIRVHP